MEKKPLVIWGFRDIVTLNKSGRGQHRKYMPYVFTEHGISMLSPLLNSEIAIEVSIKIIRAFVEIRKLMNINKNLFERVINIENTMDKNFTNIDNKLISYDNKFEQIFNALQKDEDFKQKI